MMPKCHTVTRLIAIYHARCHLAIKQARPHCQMSWHHTHFACFGYHLPACLRPAGVQRSLTTPRSITGAVTKFIHVP
jgi:hypothetical protein